MFSLMWSLFFCRDFGNTQCSYFALMNFKDQGHLRNRTWDLIFRFIERRPLKGFMKMYKTPPQRRRKKNDTEDEEGILREELNHRHLAKDIHNNQVNSVSIGCHFHFCAASRKFLSECHFHALCTEQTREYASDNYSWQYIQTLSRHLWRNIRDYQYLNWFFFLDSRTCTRNS